MRVDQFGNSFQDFLSVTERLLTGLSDFCNYIVKHPKAFQVSLKQQHKANPRVSRRANIRADNAAMSETKSMGKTVGKIANALAFIALAIDIGTAWSDNYKSGSETWVTDSIVDTLYIGIRFAISYGITALCSLIPVPVLGTIIGVALSFAVDYFIQLIVEETGFLNTVKTWAAGVGEDIKNGWNYFWSFAWI